MEYSSSTSLAVPPAPISPFLLSPGSDPAQPSVTHNQQGALSYTTQREGKTHVTRNPIWSQLNTQSPTQRIHRRLCRNRMALVRHARIMHRRTNKKIPPPPPLDLLQRRLDRIIAPKQININHALERIRAEILHRRKKVSRGATDDEIDAAELFERGGYGGFERGDRPHVDPAEAEDGRAGTDRGDFGRAFGGGFLSAAEDDGVGAEGDEGFDLGGWLGGAGL